MVGVPDVCAITDTPLLCGAGLAGAGPAGLTGAGPSRLHHDLEIGKCTTTSSMKSVSLTMLCRSSRVCSLWMYIHPLIVSRQIDLSS